MGLSEDIKDIKIKVDLVHLALLGDPTDQNKPGCLLRLDRVEQSFVILKKFVWILLPIIIVTILTVIFK